MPEMLYVVIFEFGVCIFSIRSFRREMVPNFRFPLEML